MERQNVGFLAKLISHPFFFLDKILLRNLLSNLTFNLGELYEIRRKYRNVTIGNLLDPHWNHYTIYGDRNPCCSIWDLGARCWDFPFNRQITS